MATALMRTLAAVAVQVYICKARVLVALHPHHQCDLLWISTAAPVPICMVHGADHRNVRRHLIFPEDNLSATSPLLVGTCI